MKKNDSKSLSNIIFALMLLLVIIENNMPFKPFPFWVSVLCGILVVSLSRYKKNVFFMTAMIINLLFIFALEYSMTLEYTQVLRHMILAGFFVKFVLVDPLILKKASAQ